MKKKTQQKRWYLYSLLFVVVFLCCAWLYVRSGLTETKAQLLRVLPFPIALVDSKPLFAEGFLQIKNNLSEPSKFSDKEIYEAYINYEAKKNLASSLKISFKEKSGFKNIFINSDNLDALLKSYYNDQESLSPEAHRLANNLFSRIRQGEDFAQVAKSYSADDYSKNFGGFVGIVSYEELLPEVGEKLKSVKVGETNILPSREGLHIIKVTEQLKDKVNVQQISLLVPGYENWLNKELSKIKIKTIIKT